MASTVEESHQEAGALTNGGTTPTISRRALGSAGGASAQGRAASGQPCTPLSGQDLPVPRLCTTSDRRSARKTAPIMIMQPEADARPGTRDGALRPSYDEKTLT
jgi:hypothetical protein